MHEVARWLDSRREVAPLILRLFIAFVLIYGTIDNIVSQERMHEFRDFLAKNGFPFPLASAYLSVWAQFLTGLLLLVGFLTRPAAAIVVVNFIVALVMVHVGLSFSTNIAPMAMLIGGIFFVIYGAPKYSLDEKREAIRRQKSLRPKGTRGQSREEGEHR